MQDKASIKDALEQRFNWRTFTSEPLQDRKTFDYGCQRYDEWLANESRNQISRVVGNGPHSRSLCRILPIAEGVEVSSGDTASQNTVHSSSSSTMTTTTTHQSRLPRQLSSCQQLSRAMRVFVAWKESA